MNTVEEFWITINGWDRLPRNLFDQYVEQIQEDHAHELAEQIRTSKLLRDYTDDHMIDCNRAADLIDPEVTP